MFGALGGGVKGARHVLTLGVNLLYPPACLACDAPVTENGALCPSCWADTPFNTGLSCDLCGAPLAGGIEDAPVRCDDCQHTARPWSHGRAALVYGATARALVLGLKHADRLEIAAPAGQWMARAVAPLIRADTLIAPVPLHRLRLFRRRYNQSALLAAALGRALQRPHCPDLLRRNRATDSQDGRSREGRFQNLRGAIVANPPRATRIEGRHILLVDDVMTSGATLAAATEACYQAGADDVDVVVLARVTRGE